MTLRVLVWIRRHLARLVVIALIIGVIGGVVMGLAAGTRRTASAPDRYTASAGGDPDLYVTQLAGEPLTARVASIPGVAQARSAAFVGSFPVAPDGSLVFEPNPYAGDDRLVGARIVEGRFTDPTKADEFTVNRTFAKLLADRFGTKVGDHFEVASFDQDQLSGNRAFNSGEPPAVPRFDATLVGVTETPADFDDPSPDMFFSQSFLAAHPAVGVVQTLIAMRLEPGVDPDMVMSAIHEMPNGADAFNVPYRIVSSDARRAVRFQVIALWVVTLIAAIASAIVVAQLVGRMLKMSDAEGSSLISIGWRPRDPVIERVIEGCSIAAIAAPVATIICFAVTAFFPLGVLRTFEPATGPTMDWMVTLIGILVTFAVVVIGSAIAGRRRPIHPIWADRRDRVDRFSGLVAAGGPGLALATGARLTASASTGRRRSLSSLAFGAIGLAGLVAAGVVGLSLTRLVAQPARWGENYDQLVGNPYVPTEDDIVAPVIDNADVAAVTAANIGSLTINQRDTATFAFDAAKGDLLPVTLEGRPPSTIDEIGLGAEVARRLGVGVSDVVEAVGPTGTARKVQVVGIVATPDSAGDGAAMTFDGYSSLSPTATKNVMLINFRDGAPADAVAKVQAANFTPPDALVTPTSVRALQRVTAAPFVLVIVLAVLLVVAGAYVLTASVRAGRHDLAVLRALGSDSRQLRALIHWKASLAAGSMLLLGLPSGLIVGRRIVGLLTTALGIVPGAETSPLLVVAIVVITGATANLLALMPARRAARTPVRELMRDR